MFNPNNIPTTSSSSTPNATTTDNLYTNVQQQHFNSPIRYQNAALPNSSSTPHTTNAPPNRTATPTSTNTTIQQIPSNPSSATTVPLQPPTSAATVVATPPPLTVPIIPQLNQQIPINQNIPPQQQNNIQSIPAGYNPQQTHFNNNKGKCDYCLCP